MLRARYRGSDFGRECLGIRGECDVVGIARIGALLRLGEANEPNVQEVSDDIGNDRRTGTALGKDVIVTGDLRDKGRNLGIETEALVLDEHAAHATEIDRREEILEIEI